MHRPHCQAAACTPLASNRRLHALCLGCAQVYFDVGIAETALKKPGERTIGDKSVIPVSAPVGRITLGAWPC